MSEPLTWRDERRRLGDLNPRPDNPRHIKEDEARRLVRSYDEYEQPQPLLINPDGTLLDGHQRLDVWIDEYGPDFEVDVRIPSRPLTQREWQRLTVYLHRGATGEFDFEMLADWELDEELLDWGFDEEELALEGFDFGEEELPEDPGAQVDRAEELREKWGVETGQLWGMGEHRLICGDCTDPDVVERVMGGERAKLSHHDPPYGANVVKVKGKSGRGSIGGRNWGPVGEYTPVIGDDEPFDPSHLMDTGDVVVLWGANYYADKLTPSSCWLVWDKRDGMTSNNFADCELAWGSKPAPARVFAHRWMGMMKASEHNEKRMHPTQKPVALFQWVISLFTEKGDIVSDWYCGAGGQILACERLNRKCRAVEIAPKYVAVTLERWAEMTGEEPVLVEAIKKPTSEETGGGAA